MAYIVKLENITGLHYMKTKRIFAEMYRIVLECHDFQLPLF